MSYFELKKAEIYEAVRLEGAFRIAKFLKKISLFFFFANLFCFFIYQNQEPLGISLLFLIFSLICVILEFFFNSRLKKPVIKTNLQKVLSSPEEFNLAEFFAFEPARAIFKTLRFSNSKNIEPSSTILFYFLLNDNPKLQFIFTRALLNFEDVKKKIGEGILAKSEKDFQAIIKEFLTTAKNREHQTVEWGDFLITLAKEEPIFTEILMNSNLIPEDIENLVWWQELIIEKREEEKRFWDQKNLAKLGSYGRDWATGYTVALDQYSIDWTSVLKQRGFEEIIGHKDEIKNLETILSRDTKNDALLIGEPGTGRKSIVHALAKNVLFGQSMPTLNYKRIVELDLASLFAQIESEEITESILEVIFQEAVAAENVILVIDEFQNFVAGVRRPGNIDISGIIAKYIKTPQFQLIGICTYSGLHRYIEQNSSLASLFEKVEVMEISEREAILVLETWVPFYEQKYKKFISYPALRDIVKYCSKYFATVPFPEKAINLLDEIMVDASRYIKSKVILPEHVAKIVTEKTKIPVGEIETKEKEVLLNLEKLIHQRIINQNEAVNQVSEALRRARAEITIRKGPIGAFLFLGPTGVGKTETSEALAEIYFGSEEKMIRLDMSEFQAIKDISRLIGAPGEEGLLTTRIRENPFSLLLLDEIEKAHPDILNLFLQVLDEGCLTDGIGRKVSFKNAIIIATSNAGFQIILDALKKKKSEWSKVKQQLLDYVFENAIFRPEFINRFDAVIVFNSLTKENLLDIAQLMFEKLKKLLDRRYIDFEITEDLKEKIAELGYSPVFGAREMRRVIQDKVENVLAKAILSGELGKGDKVKMDPKRFTLTIKHKYK